VVNEDAMNEKAFRTYKLSLRIPNEKMRKARKYVP
jgi:hypothetical protein